MINTFFQRLSITVHLPLSAGKITIWLKLYFLITLIDRIAQVFFLSRSCIRPGPHIFFTYAQRNHLSCSRKLASLTILVHDVVDLLYYEH